MKKRTVVIASLIICCCIMTSFLLTFEKAKTKSSTIVVVVLDTVGFRAVFNEQLGVKAPFLNSLAESSAFFSRAFSVAPWTKPAIASILTGVYPSRHGVRHPRSNITRDVPTMAEVFSRAGYKTAGVVSHVFLAPKTSYRRGFDSYQMTSFIGHVHDSITASQVTEKGLGWLAAEKKKGTENTLLFLHYFDPHFNYRHRPKFNRTSWYRGSLKESVSFSELKSRKDALSKEDIRYIKGLYQEEILATDAELQRLYEGLKRMTQDDDLTFVITADHGEAFKEHNHLGHGHHLYNELVRVPLLFYKPGAIRPQRIDRVVSTMDILPTLLDMIGRQEDASAMQGVSFLSVLYSSNPQKNRPRLPVLEVKYHADRLGVVYWPWKAILNNAEGSWRYFNLQKDPLELNPIDATGVELLVRAKVESVIDQYLRSDATKSKEQKSDDIQYSQKELETLKTLGYAM